MPAAPQFPIRRPDGLVIRVLTSRLAQQACEVESEGFADEPCLGASAHVCTLCMCVDA